MAAFWYALLGLLFTAYFVLAGADYGTGLLYGRLSRTEDERRRALAAVGPFFLGNEVWLVAALGAMIGAFPMLDGHLLGPNATMLAVLLCGLVAFTAAVQIRSRAVRGRRAFDVVIAVGALVTAVGWGTFLGQLLQGRHGVPNWYALLCGLVFATLVLLHGAAFLALRGTTDLKARAAAVLTAGIAPVLIGLAAVLGLGLLTADAVGDGAVAAGLALLLAAAVFAAGRLTAAGRHGGAFAATCAAMALPVLIVGLSRLPYAHVDAGDPSASLTVAQAASDPATLRLLSITAAPLIPVLLAFQAVTWWLHRRRVDASTPLFY